MTIDTRGLALPGWNTKLQVSATSVGYFSSNCSNYGLFLLEQLILNNALTTPPNTEHNLLWMTLILLLAAHQPGPMSVFCPMLSVCDPFFIIHGWFPLHFCSIPQKENWSITFFPDKLCGTQTSKLCIMGYWRLASWFGQHLWPKVVQSIWHLQDQNDPPSETTDRYHITDSLCGDVHKTSVETHMNFSDNRIL